MVNIYDALKFAGCILASHESDLYVKAGPTARRVIREALNDGRLATRPTLFEATDNSGVWYEIPFAYQPFWDRKLKR